MVLKRVNRELPGCLALFVLLPAIPASAQEATAIPELVWHQGHASTVMALAFTPDGKILVSGSADSTVKLWDAATGHELRTLKGHSILVLAIAISPDGKRVASGGSEGTVPLWDIATGARLKTFSGPSDMIDSLAFSADGTLLAAGSTDKKAWVWNTATGRSAVVLSGSPDEVQSVAISPDKQLVAGGTNNLVLLWDAKTGAIAARILCKGAVRRATFSPDGRILAFNVNPGGQTLSSPGSTVDLWDVQARTLVRTVPGAVDDGYLSFSADGRQLAFGRTSPLQVVDAATGKAVASFDVPVEKPMQAALTRDWKMGAAGGSDGDLRITDLATGRSVQTDPPVQAIRVARVSPDGRWMASGGLEKSISIWELASGRLARNITTSDSVSDLAFTPDSHTLISTGGYTGVIQLWDVVSGRSTGQIPAKEVFRLRLSPDGRRLACLPGALTQNIEIWDLSTRKLVSSLRTQHTKGVTTFGWSPDGERIVTGGAGSIRIWDARTGQPRGQAISVGTAQSVNGISFSPDGRRLAAGLGIYGRTAKIWDAQTGAELQTMTSRTGSVDEVIFDGKGRRLFTAGANSVRIWDSSSGALLKTLSGHTAAVNTLELTRDETRLITASEDGMMRVWDAQTGESLATFVAAGGGGWMVYAADGLFDGAADSFGRFGWRVRNAPATVSLSAFFTDFFYPGLLASVLSGERPKAEVDIGLALQVPSLHAMLDSKEAHVETRGDSLVVCFDAPPTALVPDLAAGGPLLANDTGEVTVDPADKTCKFRKVLGPRQNDQAARLVAWKPTPITTPWDGKSSGTSNSILHVLCIGIDEYQASSGFNPLKYSAASARAVHDYFSALSRSGAKSWPEIRIWDPLYDRQASLAAIRGRFKAMVDAVKPGDSVLVLLSGHGYVPPAEEMFYFIPADGKGTTSGDLQQNALSTAMLAEALREIPAQRVMLILDTCQSGAAVESLQKIAQVKARAALREAQATGTTGAGVGVYVLAAATPLEFAVLSSRLQKSALAEAILESLGSGAEARVSARQLLAKVQELLPALSSREAGFSQNAMVSTVGLDFPVN